MRRAIGLGVVVAVGALSMTTVSSRGASQGSVQQAPKTAEIEKVKDNLYLLHGLDRGTRLNVTAFVGSAGVVVIDTGFPGWGRVWLDAIKSVTSKPVTTIISTHTHSDHTGSNSEFGANLTFVAHESTKANLEREQCTATGGCANFQGENKKYLPGKTFKDRMSLFSGVDKIDLYYFGRGHTGGDAVVVFPALRAAATGDLFAWRGVPRIMPEDGGSAVAFPQTLAKAQATIRDVDTLVTGHSKVMAWKDWIEYREFLAEFVTQVQAANKAGRTIDQALGGLRMPGKYRTCDPKLTSTTELRADADCAYRMDQARADAQIIYDEMKK
jgi:glyoxylase-like metal-dependent hydrolase (beta-lactamase superfamily II)